MYMKVWLLDLFRGKSCISGRENFIKHVNNGWVLQSGSTWIKGDNLYCHRKKEQF